MRSLIFVMAISSLGGCATIVNGTMQSIAITSVPEGARCELSNSQGVWLVTSPGSVVVQKTKSDMQVVCKKDGYVDGTKLIHSRFGLETAGNLIAGGLIGIGIDAASGADYSYPTHNQVWLRRPNEPALSFLDGLDLSTPASR